MTSLTFQGAKLYQSMVSFIYASFPKLGMTAESRFQVRDLCSTNAYVVLSSQLSRQAVADILLTPCSTPGLDLDPNRLSVTLSHG